jgi:hypothetical protein
MDKELGVERYPGGDVIPKERLCEDCDGAGCDACGGSGYIKRGQADDPDAGLVMCTSCGKMSKFKPATGEDGSEYMECQSCGGLDTNEGAREGRRGQFDPKVNDQQDDAVKPPKAKQPLGEESSQQDIESLEPSSILDSHPASDQAGTSEPDDNMGEGVNDEEGFSDPSVKPQHPAADQDGVSLPATDLGRHSSDEEPAAFDVGKVSPGRSARVDRASLRDALRATVKHVRDDENV